MAYLIFGFALGTFISGLIAKFYDKHSGWINPNYLFYLSSIFFLLFIYIGWPILKRAFT